MELFRFCLEIIRREAKRFNVGIKNSTVCQLTAATANNINYDDAHNRCAFLYRCGTINVSFAKDCFCEFLSDSNVIEHLLAKWRFSKCLTFCSMSKGPALDIIALLLSIDNEQCNVLTSLIQNIRIITKHGAWRNTANIMLEMVNEGYFKHISSLIQTLEVTQGDPFLNFTEKVKLPINDSDVVIMIKALNLQSDGFDQEKISKNIEEFLDALRPGAVLFCIDTKPSIKEITQVLTAFSGKFLLHPKQMNTLIQLEHTEIYMNQFGCVPIQTARGCFFVWEKSSVSTSSIQNELNVTSEPIKNKFGVADKVNTYESGLEFSCMTLLNKNSKSPNEELLEHCEYCSTPKLSEKSSEANSSFRNEDLLLADNVSCYQKSVCPLPSDSSVNGSISLSNQLATSLNSSRYELDSVSNTNSFKKSLDPLSSASSVSRGFVSSPSLFEAENLNSLISMQHDLDSASSTKNIEQSSNLLSSSAAANESISYNFETKCLQSLRSLKSQIDLISNECLQVTSVISKETEINKITEKVTDLTMELTKLLENSTLKSSATKNCFRCSEEMGNHFENKANFCSSMISGSRMSQNLKTCCCKKCTCHFHLSSNCAMCDKTSDCYRSQSNAGSSILTENALLSAQIVIPLNNLPASVVSQIISLITKPNHE